MYGLAVIASIARLNICQILMRFCSWNRVLDLDFKFLATDIKHFGTYTRTSLEMDGTLELTDHKMRLGSVFRPYLKRSFTYTLYIRHGICIFSLQFNFIALDILCLLIKIRLLLIRYNKTWEVRSQKSSEGALSLSQRIFERSMAGP